MFRILFQLKRFYFIYCKESLLFFKKIYKNSRNSLFKKKDNIFIRKAIPNINKEIDIVLDHKEYRTILCKFATIHNIEKTQKSNFQ